MQLAPVTKTGTQNHLSDAPKSQRLHGLGKALHSLMDRVSIKHKVP